MAALADRELIIDGYNLMLTMRTGKPAPGPGNLERSRSTFLNWLNRHAKVRGRWTVVFDARDDQRKSAPIGRRRSPQYASHGNLQVLFAEGYQDADALIGDLCRQAEENGTRLVVVSGDRQVLQLARKCRHQVIESNAFYKQLTQPVAPRNQIKTTSADEKEAVETSDDVSHWLEAFGTTIQVSPERKPPPKTEIPEPKPKVDSLDDAFLLEFQRQMEADLMEQMPPKPRSKKKSQE